MNVHDRCITIAELPLVKSPGQESEPFLKLSLSFIDCRNKGYFLHVQRIEKLGNGTSFMLYSGAADKVKSAARYSEKTLVKLAAEYTAEHAVTRTMIAKVLAKQGIALA